VGERGDLTRSSICFLVGGEEREREDDRSPPFTRFEPMWFEDDWTVRSSSLAEDNSSIERGRERSGRESKEREKRERKERTEERIEERREERERE